MNPSRARTALRRTTIGLLIVGGIGSACSSSNSAEPSTTTTVATSTSTAGSPVAVTGAPTTSIVPVTTSATPSETTPPPDSTSPPDGVAVLQSAFESIAAGYHFVTTATVNGQVAATAEGDHVGDATQLTVTSNGASVGYIVLPDATWVLDAGEWKELDEVAPVSDPLSSLRAPSGVSVASYEADRVTLVASYPAPALGLPGDGQVEVVFQVQGTNVQSLEYSSVSATGSASVSAILSPLADTTAITAPSA